MLLNKIIIHDQVIHPCFHKTFVSVFRRTNNRLASHIKTRMNWNSQDLF